MCSCFILIHLSVLMVFFLFLFPRRHPYRDSAGSAATKPAHCRYVAADSCRRSDGHCARQCGG